MSSTGLGEAAAAIHALFRGEDSEAAHVGALLLAQHLSIARVTFFGPKKQPAVRNLRKR